ncbi:2285_t:CDS:1, partial [Dentiscutata erythropus]
ASLTLSLVNNIDNLKVLLANTEKLLDSTTDEDELLEATTNNKLPKATSTNKLQ